MTPRRRALNRQLWSLVRELPNGEQAMRDMVGQLRQEDGSGAELAGSDQYTSTRLLTDKQFQRLLLLVRQRLGRPSRRRSDSGDVLWMVSPKERKYIAFLARGLGWNQETLQAFIERQAKGKSVRTHRQASAVIEPMERMLRLRGWTLDEIQGRKWWTPPASWNQALKEAMQ